jgi:hypothetical protein
MVGKARNSRKFFKLLPEMTACKAEVTAHALHPLAFKRHVFPAAT